MSEYTVLLALLGALGIYLWYRGSRARREECPGHGQESLGSDTGRTEGPGAAYAVDPVCGMKVKRAGAEHTSEHDNRLHYFCSAACRMTFDVEPERYLVPGPAEAGSAR